MRVFVYGTLMYERIALAVGGTAPQFQNAVLKGYTRVAVAGKLYPTIIEDPKGFVQGKLWSEPSKKAQKFLKLFDAISREHHVKKELTVVTEAGGKTLATVYTAGKKLLPLAGGEWKEDVFRKEYLASYYEEVVEPFSKTKC